MEQERHKAALVEDESVESHFEICNSGCFFGCEPVASCGAVVGRRRSAIPHSVQQLVAIDYHAMENSNAAMDLRARVMPPELKRFEDALKNSGLNENHDVEQLSFALFRPKEGEDRLETVGLAQGQFSTQEILANFRKLKLKATLVRNNRVFPQFPPIH